MYFYCYYVMLLFYEFLLLLCNVIFYVFLLLCNVIFSCVFIVNVMLLFYVFLLLIYFTRIFMYSYCYVCSVLYILFPPCQLSLFGYPDCGFTVLFPQL